MNMMIVNKVVTTEVGCEYTMPDYQPEIRRLLRVQATVLPPATYVGAGRAEFAGAVRYDLLYAAADGSLHAVSVNENYQLSAPIDKDADIDFSEDIPAFCHIESEALSGRVTAPRKLSIRCRLRGTVRAFGRHRPVERMHGRIPGGIERLLGEATCCRLTRSASETVTLSDEVNLGGAVRVISCDATGVVSEIQPVQDGVGCRGEMVVKIMTAADGQDTTPTVTLRRLPFQVTVAAEDFNGETCAWGRVRCTEISAEATEDGRVLCDMTAVVTVEGQENVTEPYTADIYSTECESSTVYEECTFPVASRCLSGNFTQSVYEPLASYGLAPDCEVLDVCASASVDSVVHEKGKWILSGESRVLLLTRTEEEFSSCELSLPFRYEADGEGGVPMIVDSDVQMLTGRARVEGGRLSLECEMAITARICIGSSITSLAEVTFGDAVAHPSEVVVAYPLRGETVWSLAKRYHAPLSNFTAGAPGSPLTVGCPIVVFE